MPAESSIMDSIPTSVLKSSVDLFAPLIARLIALSFTEGTFPSRFKVASVTPLLKKKGLDRSMDANFRPISNLHTISEIIERVILSRITAHVKSSIKQPINIRLMMLVTQRINKIESLSSTSSKTERNCYNTPKMLISLLIINQGHLLQLDLFAAFDTIDQSTWKSRL